MNSSGMEWRLERPARHRAAVNRVTVVVAALAIGALAGCGSATGSNPVPSFQPSGGAGGSGGQGSPGPHPTETNAPGDIPDTTAFVAYPDVAGFVVNVPEGWARSQTGSTVTFSDKLNSVAITSSHSAAPPTEASVTATQVPALTSLAAQFQLVGVSTVTRAAGSAVLVKYLADSAVNPVTNKVVRDSVELYLFWHNGTLVTLSLVGSVGADNVDPWHKVTDSLSWTK